MSSSARDCHADPTPQIWWASAPAYLSQVEQGDVDPPTAQRVRKIAELPGENADEMITLADRLPEDLPGIIKSQPAEMPDLLREASGLTPEQLRKLIEKVRKLKEKGGG